MRFCLDEDLSPTVAEIARRRGLDVVSAHEGSRRALPDEEQLRLAVEDGRCLVTCNSRHFVPLTVGFLARGWPHAGVLILPPSLPGRQFAAIAEALVRYEHEHPEGVPAYTVDFVQPAP